jgi:glycerol uptake facilitator-like aquaporin
MGIDWIAAAWRSAITVLRVFWKVTRQLFHEMTGTLFALFAISGAIAIWRLWSNARIPWLLAAASAYTIMMLYFSVTSFRSARRVR